MPLPKAQRLGAPDGDADLTCEIGLLFGGVHPGDQCQSLIETCPQIGGDQPGLEQVGDAHEVVLITGGRASLVLGVEVVEQGLPVPGQRFQLRGRPGHGPRYPVVELPILGANRFLVGRHRTGRTPFAVQHPLVLGLIRNVDVDPLVRRERLSAAGGVGVGPEPASLLVHEQILARTRIQIHESRGLLRGRPQKTSSVGALHRHAQLAHHGHPHTGGRRT